MCDGKRDCKQAEDEDENTCFGSSGINYYVLGTIMAYFILGTIAYLGNPNVKSKLPFILILNSLFLFVNSSCECKIQ